MTDLDIGIETGDAFVAILKAMTDESSPVRGTVIFNSYSRLPLSHHIIKHNNP